MNRAMHEAKATSMWNLVRRVDNFFRREMRLRWELRVWFTDEEEPIVVTGVEQAKLPPMKGKVIVREVPDEGRS